MRRGSRAHKLRMICRMRLLLNNSEVMSVRVPAGKMAKPRWSVCTTKDSTSTLSSINESSKPDSFFKPTMWLIWRFTTSQSTSTTETSRSSARLKDKLRLVKVLPSPGSALVTMMTRGSPGTADAMAFSTRGRLMRR